MVSQIPTSSKFHFKKSNSGGHPIPSKHAAIPLGIKEIMDGAFFACRQEHEQPAPIHALKAMSDSEVQPHAWRCNDLVGLAPYTVADGSAQVSVLAPHAPMSPPPRAARSEHAGPIRAGPGEAGPFLFFSEAGPVRSEPVRAGPSLAGPVRSEPVPAGPSLAQASPGA